jgi:hypothetical protein
MQIAQLLQRRRRIFSSGDNTLRLLLLRRWRDANDAHIIF